MFFLGSVKISITGLRDDESPIDNPQEVVNESMDV